eukprot:2099512-Amphidinium_carterae.2
MTPSTKSRAKDRSYLQFRAEANIVAADAAVRCYTLLRKVRHERLPKQHSTPTATTNDPDSCVFANVRYSESPIKLIFKSLSVLGKLRTGLNQHGCVFQVANNVKV